MSEVIELIAEPGSNHGPAASLIERYRTIRQVSEQLAEPLSAEDCLVQSMPDVSPTKWHLAHTSWFFETFVLRAASNSYRTFDPQFQYLFNSYYEAVGPRHERPKRGLLSRPSLQEVHAYRAHVDQHMQSLLTSPDAGSPELAAVIEIGLNHEQQHQELIVTDIKHVFSCNPLEPTYRPRPDAQRPPPDALAFIPVPGGLHTFGCRGAGFAFDNERPPHPAYLQRFSLADRVVTNREYLAFIEAGGYARAEHWLSDGWMTIQREGWQAPLYWQREPSGWSLFTLAGRRPLNLDEPVCHVSFYEADAYARWARARLPTEYEWELAAQHAQRSGNFLESGAIHPRPAAPIVSGTLQQMFGDVWEWTASPYVPYPGYSPASGALGEYNGKFMCNQIVLRGGSCATSATHIRPSYRNFFPADARWQFSGIRLAR